MTPSSWAGLHGVRHWPVDEKIALFFVVVPISVIGLWKAAKQGAYWTSQAVSIGASDPNRAMAEAARWQTGLSWCSLVVAMIAALFAYRAMAENRKTAQTQLRAYVQADTNGAIWNERKVAVSVKLVNTGDTPARHLSVSLGMRIIALPHTEEATEAIFNTLAANEKHRTSLGKGLELRPSMEVPSSALPQFALADAVDGTKSLVVLGVVEYSDVFGRSFRTRFFHHYAYPKLGSNEGIIHHFGNEAS